MEIAPGQRISVEVVAQPRNSAARKTLTRVFRNDPDVARRSRAMVRHRPSWEQWRRGGNQWHHQMKSRVLFSIANGARFTLLATVDVLRDLESVGRCVRITPA